MKKILSFLLCVTLLCGSISAYAEEPDVLPDEAGTGDAELSGETAAVEAAECAGAEEPDAQDIPPEPTYALIFPAFSGVAYLAEETYLGELYFLDAAGFPEDTMLRVIISASRFSNEYGDEIPYDLVIRYTDGSFDTVPAGDTAYIDCLFENETMLLNGTSLSAGVFVAISPEAWTAAKEGHYSASVDFTAEIVRNAL